VGIAARARQPSVAGSYSHVLLTGFQPAACGGKVKPPNKIHFSVQRSDRRVVDRMRHRLLLRPRVSGRIVLVHEPGRLESGQEPLGGVDLAVDRDSSNSPVAWGKGASLIHFPCGGGAGANRRLRAQSRSCKDPHEPFARSRGQQSQARATKILLRMPLTSWFSRRSNAMTAIASHAIAAPCAPDQSSHTGTPVTV